MFNAIPSLPQTSIICKMQKSEGQKGVPFRGNPVESDSPKKKEECTKPMTKGQKAMAKTLMTLAAPLAVLCPPLMAVELAYTDKLRQDKELAAKIKAEKVTQNPS